MTSTTERYQGWTNYPTWAVNLWLSNDEPLYNAALYMAENAVDDAPTDENVAAGIWNVTETAKYRLADSYKEWCGGMVETEDASFGSDLLGWAMEQVDWEEIAASWISNVAEISA